MQTKSIDALRLWWRDINFSNSQRRALAASAVLAVAVSAFFIFKPHHAAAKVETVPTILTPPMVVVDVTGDVKTPGVYELQPNARVIDALKAAGGANMSADLSLINLARVVKDGEQIYVDKKVYSRTTIHKTSNGLININRATAKEFESLPGIGPVLASRIVEYRKINGSFANIDDLKKIPGIGGSKLEKFRAKIRV